MTPLTSAECLAIAERKIAQAIGDRRHGKELRATAEAWLVLAQKIAQAEAIEARVVASSFISDNPQPKLVSRVNHIEHAQKGSVDASPI